MCGSSDCASSLSRSARRCCTPKRCCSSMIASPSRANATSLWITAWVPTTSAASPEATRASISRRPLPLRLPVSQATPMPSGSSQPTSLRKCCSARISVGAISAHSQPLSIAIAAASAATTVLPEPTSPCSRRCIGVLRCRSAAISCPTRCWERVSANGSAASSRSCSPPARNSKRGAGCDSRSRRACSCDSCCASNSSNFSRCHAGWLRSSSVASDTSGAGWCRKRKASRKLGKPRGTRSAGTISARSARCNPEATALRK